MKNRKDGYTKKEVSELLGITPYSIAFYSDRGLIIPEVANPRVRGAKRRYSKGNMIEFLLIKLLVKYGLQHEKIRSLFEFFYSKAHGDLLKGKGQISFEDRRKSREKYREQSKSWASELLINEEFKGNRIFLLIHNASGKAPEPVLEYRSLDEDIPEFKMIRGGESVLVIDITRLFRAVDKM